MFLKGINNTGRLALEHLYDVFNGENAQYRQAVGSIARGRKSEKLCDKMFDFLVGQACGAPKGRSPGEGERETSAMGGGVAIVAEMLGYVGDDAAESLGGIGGLE